MDWSGDRRDRLCHGCERVRDLLVDDPDTAGAAAYLEAMERRLPEEYTVRQRL